MTGTLSHTKKEDENYIRNMSMQIDETKVGTIFDSNKAVPLLGRPKGCWLEKGVLDGAHSYIDLDT